MADEDQIVLIPQISDSRTTIAKLNKQIKKLSDKLDSISLTINMDKNMTTQINRYFQSFNRAVQITNGNLSTHLNQIGLVKQAIDKATEAQKNWKIHQAAASTKPTTSAESKTSAVTKPKETSLKDSYSSAKEIMDFYTKFREELSKTSVESEKSTLNQPIAGINKAAAASSNAQKSIGLLSRSFLALSRVVSIPTLVLTGVTWGISKLIGASASAKAKFKEITTIVSTQVTSLVALRSELESLSFEYSDLKAAEKIGGTSIAQKQRLMEIQTELVSKYGVSATGINEEGKAFSDSIELINARTGALVDQIKVENERNKSKFIVKD
ncbi:MAG: hypothetical protein K0Q73_6205, partial [Paenibacillus sp.]|nr:hypothetical protein [Paenibacillus sp.]